MMMLLSKALQSSGSTLLRRSGRVPLPDAAAAPSQSPVAAPSVEATADAGVLSHAAAQLEATAPPPGAFPATFRFNDNH